MRKIAIVLAECPDRVEFHRAQSARVGMEFETVPGIHSGSGAWANIAYSRSAACGAMGAMKAGEIGCAGAWANLWGEIHTGGKDALAIEDDCHFVEDEDWLMRHYAALPDDWDLFLTQRWEMNGISETCDNPLFERVVRPAWGLSSIVVRHRAAEKVLSGIFPIRVPADAVVHPLVERGELVAYKPAGHAHFSRNGDIQSAINPFWR